MIYLETLQGTNSVSEYSYPAWPNTHDVSSQIPNILPGTESTISLDFFNTPGNYYYRVYAKNLKGQAFSYRTGKVTIS